MPTYSNDVLQGKLAHLPRLMLTTRQLYDVEMLLSGGFSPLKGFLTKKEYESVIERMRLPDGSLWPIPVVLDMPQKMAEHYALQKKDVYEAQDTEIILTDTYGNPLAILTVESVYSPDKDKEASMVYGTHDSVHPGVRYLFHDTGDVYVGGKVTLIQHPVHYDFTDLRKTPADLRREFSVHAASRKNIIAFQTRNPIHKVHFHLITSLAKEHNAHILIQPTVGPTKEGDIDYVSRVKSYIALHKAHMSGVTLALLPLAMRMAGPREAVWHALIRKNYGATHFIIGRDHAGPGKDAEGNPFYEPYAAQKLALELQSELGIKIVPAEEFVYIQELDEYVPLSKVKPHHTVLNISGTAFRDMLKNGKEVPDWFSFPEVVNALRKVAHGVAMLFTGLSGAGKSTLAGHLAHHIEKKTHKAVTHLDGDIVRTVLSRGLGFSKEDRLEHIKRIGFVAGEIVRHDGTVLISIIAPYREARHSIKRQVEQYGGAFYEIFVDASLDTLRTRDVKGLYVKSDTGLLKNLTGVDAEYETPQSPHITIITDNETVDESVKKLAELVKNWLPSDNFSV